MTTAPKPRFYGYARASTAGQQYTYEAQEKAILKAYEDRYKDTHEWGGVFKDKATSGAKPFTEREEGLRLWVLAQKGDVVCWSKMDRAFRNVFDASQLLQMFSTKGVAMLSLDIALDTATALGKFVMHLLASVAELEREWIRTRTKDALAIRQEKGLPHGGRPPVGWMKRTDGVWTHDTAERRLIEWAIELHDTKKMSWKAIAAHLTTNGVRRANGDRYRQQWFHYALKAREAGYPGRDGFREQCVYGGSVRREGKVAYRRKLKADLRKQTAADQGGHEESSLPSEGPAQTPAQTP